MGKKSGFEMYKDERKEWRWRFQSPNGNVIAESGEGYKNRLDCLTGALLFQDLISGLDIKEIALQDALREG